MQPAVPEQEQLTRTLQEERYLAHSRTLAQIARQEHCRDHDELWEQLVELRPRDDLSDWRRTCHDVLVWSALARLDYEPEVLAAEGSLDREARMAARIREWRARVDGPVVVVTGGFHTLALVEALTGAPEGDQVRALEPAGGYGPPTGEDTAAWLIRYDFARLDALRGYGAGMPSPGFHQRMWRWLTTQEPTEHVTAELPGRRGTAGACRGRVRPHGHRGHLRRPGARDPARGPAGPPVAGSHRRARRDHVVLRGRLRSRRGAA